MEAKKQSLMESTVNMEEGIQFAWTNINVSTKAVPERKAGVYILKLIEMIANLSSKLFRRKLFPLISCKVLTPGGRCAGL